MAVDDWLEADAANHEAFWQLSRVWEQQGHAYKAPDVGQEWERFAANRKPAKVRRIRAVWWAGAAAAVTLVCLLTVYQFRNKPGSSLVSEEVAVQLHAEHAIVRDTLPDRSIVVLPPGSSLSYPAAFKQRTVTLGGEGYFDIQPDENRPFEMVVEELRIRVLGTAFNVRTAPEDIVVQVISGAVQIRYGNKDSVITAGQQFNYNRIRQTCVVESVTPEERNTFAYATQLLQFDGTRLDEVVRQVGKTYNVNIVLTNPKTAACLLSTEFNGQPLPYVLDVITASLGLSYTINGNNINISGDECK